MAAFLGDIAFLFGILITASGLLVLHKASSDPKPKLLNIAGKLLVIAGILTALCTTYFYFKYHLAGELEHPYPIHGTMMKDMHEQSEIEDDEHETHHPDE
jgi:small-conductance mechanosensitive channel